MTDTNVFKNKDLFDDSTSQDDTSPKDTESSNSDDFQNKNDIENKMSENKDDNPTTSITIIKENNHPTNVITDNTNEINTHYELIYREYFVDLVKPNQNKKWRNKDPVRWEKLMKQLSDHIFDYLKDRMITEAQKQNT